MDLSGDFNGIDFDRFAKDASGRLALFTTAGGGFVPQSVALTHESHTSTSSLIATPHMGTGLLWGDYGAAGLYVYDWTWPDGPYGLVQYPTQEMGANLREAILRVPALPLLQGDFPSTKLVDATDLVAT